MTRRPDTRFARGQGRRTVTRAISDHSGCPASADSGQGQGDGQAEVHDQQEQLLGPQVTDLAHRFARQLLREARTLR
jgi:hypothetical protein